MARRPTGLFQDLRIVAGGRGLLAINLTLAAFVLVDPWVGVLAYDPARGAWNSRHLLDLARHAGMLLAWMGAAGGVLFGLTLVEYQGVRFFARLRGWRLTREAAWQVCAHASAAWILAGLLPLLVLAAMQAALRFFGVAPHGEIDFNTQVPGTTRVLDLVSFGGPALGYLAGLLAFEFLVHRGVRACKYAATDPMP